MGLLSQSTQKRGLLARSQAPTPVPTANSTPTGFPTFEQPVINPTPAPLLQPVQKPASGLLSGASVISQGKVSLKDKLLAKLPNNLAGDVIRGVVNAPEEIAKEIGFFDEDKTVKLDRIAQELIAKGIDPTRAYEIAGNQVQQSQLNPNIYGLKNAKEQEKALAITPQEKSATVVPGLLNKGMTGLTVANYLPGVGSIEKQVGKKLLTQAEKDAAIEVAPRVGKQSIEQLQAKGLLTKITDPARVQEVKNSIAEGEGILKAGGINGRKMSEDELANVAKSVDSAKAKIAPVVEDYGMSHRPTAGVRAFDLTEKVDGEQMIPKDMYERWYGSRGTLEDKESISVLKKIKDNPEAEVTIYRASPKDEFNEGDWVTFSKNYAKTHAEGNGTKVFSKTVKAKDVRWAMDDINEFGYYPEPVKPTPILAKEKQVTRTPEETAAMRSKTPARREAPILAKPVKKEVTQAEYDKLKTEMDYYNMQYENGIERYNALVKYQEGGKNNKFSDGLPEVIGKEGTNANGRRLAKNSHALTFQKRGDTFIEELGFADRDEANDWLASFKNIIEDRKITKEELARTSASKIPIRKPAPAPKKVESTVTKGEEILSQVPSAVRKEVRSLPSIIDRHYTDVKGKVNLLDYIRTPDRVLEKIGFADEAKQVRKAYEAYTKELPTNIDKITAWSKEVPKESNELIFKYLDGQKDITLNKTEQKVADEVSAWLKEWATRLRLPIDNQISKYITHIFDSTIVAKEFDEDLAKIITDKIPGQVYDPFLLKRLGAKGYKQDTWAALDAYVKRATRKVHMDPALDAIQSRAGVQLEFSNLEASQFKYIQRYVNNVNMRPTELDNLIDNTLKSIFGYKYGTRPVTYLTKLFRRLTFRGMLGFNPGSALRNLSQGINTYAVLGEKYTALGYAKLFNPGARAELDAAGVFTDNFIQDRTLSSTKKAMEKIDKGLFALFNTAEHINRGAAYFGAKAKGISKGMTEEKAIEYAKKVVRDTQFSFGSIDTPVALQNDIVKTLTQFQTYTIKQIEFLTEMSKDKNFIGLLRYAAAGLAFTYTIGKAFDMKPEQLIPSLRFDTPPSLKAPVETAKALLNTPDKYGKPRSLKQKASDVGKSFIGLIPGGTQAKKTYEGAQLLKKGGSFDKGGNLQFEAPQTTKGKVQALLFGKYAGEKAQKYFNREDEATKDMEAVRPTYDKVQQLMAEGKEEEAQAIVDSLGDKGYEIYKKIRSQDRAEKTKKGKMDILPTYQKVQKLVGEGKEEEAQAIVDGLTEEEYKYYGLLKEQLSPP